LEKIREGEEMSGDGRNENEVYSDDLVRITSTRVVIGGVTYALRNITSVRAYKETRYAAMASAASLAVLGVLFLFNSVKSLDFESLVLGVVFLGAGYAVRRLSPPMWHVGIRTSSGEDSALHLRNPQRIYLIAEKISDALANY
jgi:Family of unknown function (DUF6232)